MSGTQFAISSSNSESVHRDERALLLLIQRMRLAAVPFLFALTLGFSMTANAEKPFDFGATPGRLPKPIVPEEE